MREYRPLELDRKWQQRWAETRAFEVSEDAGKPKFYCLEMFAYPSGHAAHSVFYVWLAVTIAVRLMPDMVRKTALVTGGILLSVLVGLSRVYLNVHYLSDVFGGWALGALCFAFFAVAALLVTQLRKN